MNQHFRQSIICGLLMLGLSFTVQGERLSTSSAGTRTVLDANQQQIIKSLIRKKQYSEVIALLEDSQILTGNWQANFWLGTAYLMQDQLPAARKALDSALELRGDIAEIWVQRAIVEQERDKANVALQLLNVALQINAQCEEAYLNAAYAYEQLGNIEAARAAYGYFLKLSVNNPRGARLRQQVLSRIVKLR
jgi:tetratricopeptide (TPR) repeat protein